MTCAAPPLTVGRSTTQRFVTDERKPSLGIWRVSSNCSESVTLSPTETFTLRSTTRSVFVKTCNSAGELETAVVLPQERLFCSLGLSGDLRNGTKRGVRCANASYSGKVERNCVSSHLALALKNTTISTQKRSLQ
jgi:hypothetical protein